MCRMIGFSAQSDIPIQPFLERLLEMAKYGKRAPHPDGWGYFALSSSGLVSYVKTSRPIFESEISSVFKAKLLIAHARKASKSTLKGNDQAHPLMLMKNEDVYVLAHNGFIEAPSGELGMDSEYILRIFSKHGPIEGANRLLSESYKSLNFLLFHNDTLYAFRACRENCDYYTLFLKEENGVAIISSESDGRLLKNGELVELRNGRVAGKWLLRTG